MLILINSRFGTHTRRNRVHINHNMQPLRRSGYNNYPMQSKAESDPHGIWVGIKFNVNCPPLRICGTRGGEQCQRGARFGNACIKFSLPHRWKLALHKISTKSSMAVFSHHAAVGNLTTITTAVNVWWQYEYCTLFWMTCLCSSLTRSSSLYIHPFEAIMAMSNVHNMSISSR